MNHLFCGDEKQGEGRSCDGDDSHDDDDDEDDKGSESRNGNNHDDRSIMGTVERCERRKPMILML